MRRSLITVYYYLCDIIQLKNYLRKKTTKLLTKFFGFIVLIIVLIDSPSDRPSKSICKIFAFISRFRFSLTYFVGTSIVALMGRKKLYFKKLKSFFLIYLQFLLLFP